MSVIQKIRNQYGKIAGAVIAIALVSFIISDAKSGSFGGIFGGHDSHVVTINGTKIESKEYEMRVKEYETLTEIYSNRGPLDDAGRAQIREQVMQQMEYETIVNSVCDKLGLEASEQEKKDLIYGANAHQLVRQFTFMGQQVFNNPDTKQFDPARVKGIEDQMTHEPQKYDPYGKYMESWNAVKNYVLRSTKVDKFNTLMAASVYAPTYEVKRAVDNQNMMASIRFIKVPFTSVPDNDVKVSDDDIKAYMQKHKAMFETDQAARSIDYVSFEIVPASADSGRAVDALNEMKDEFSKTKDKDIKTFVNTKTDDINLYSEAFVNKKNFVSKYADTIMAQPVGSIFGPYLENGSYRITKMIDKKVLPDSVKFKQIIVVENTGKELVLADSLASKRMDSIIAAINSGTPFDSLLKLSSNFDPNNPKGEVPVTLAQRPQLVQNLAKEVADFIFEGKKGERKRIKADNSKENGPTFYTYIEIVDQSDIASCVQMATISKNLLPSDSTVNAIFARANEFAAKSTNAAEFDANLKKMNLDKRVGENIKENGYTVAGLGGARDVVKWMFTHKVGEVSNDPFRLSDQRYVVAKLTSIDEKGQMPISANTRPQFEQKVREEKKADLIANKYKGATLESIAAAVGQAVGQSDSVMLGAGFIPGLGYEPKVVGYAFSPACQPNTVSPGIKSNGGVYFITLLNKMAKQVDPMMAQNDAMQQLRNVEMQNRNYLTQMLQQSITKNADIKYNIKNF